MKLTTEYSDHTEILKNNSLNLCFRVMPEVDPKNRFKAGCFQNVIDMSTVFICRSFAALTSSSVYSVYSVV